MEYRDEYGALPIIPYYRDCPEISIQLLDNAIPRMVYPFSSGHERLKRLGFELKFLFTGFVDSNLADLAKGKSKCLLLSETMKTAEAVPLF